MKKNNINEIVAIGIGIPLFIVSTYIAIPVGINTSIQTRLAVITLFSVLYGPKVGFTIGFAGHALADALFYGNIWWSWVIADGILGFGLGIISTILKLKTSKITQNKIILFNVLQLVLNIICWVIIAPVLDVYIYSEPLYKVMIQGILSATANTIVVGAIGILLLKMYFKNNEE